MGSVPPIADGVEVVARSRSCLLLGDDEGYYLWDLRHGQGAPVAEFGLGDDNLDEAIDRFDRLQGLHRRERLLTVLAWVVVAVGALWLIHTIALFTLMLVIVATEDTDVMGLSLRVQAMWLPVWAMPNAFFVAVGLYVVVWMQLYSRRRGD